MMWFQLFFLLCMVWFGFGAVLKPLAALQAGRPCCPLLPATSVTSHYTSVFSLIINPPPATSQTNMSNLGESQLVTLNNANMQNCIWKSFMYFYIFVPSSS
jgi:hypothetical protein